MILPDRANRLYCQNINLCLGNPAYCAYCDIGATICARWEIELSLVFGILARYTVASRDIPACQLILREQPAVQVADSLLYPTVPMYSSVLCLYTVLISLTSVLYK